MTVLRCYLMDLLVSSSFVLWHLLLMHGLLMSRDCKLGWFCSMN